MKKPQTITLTDAYLSLSRAMKIFIAFFLAITLYLTLTLSLANPIHAATTITVNSTADDEDNDGECTLREAITASNTDTASGAAAGECAAGSGNDTIEFNITGVADFTNGGQDGYTISPTSELPEITETVTIDGYTQPGSQPNTAEAPQPLNGTLLVEVDGSGAGDAFGLDVRGDGTIIQGLVIGNFSQRAAIGVGATNIAAQGNYLGTDPSGTIARPNLYGLSVSDTDSTDALIGGLDPSDRNLVSGNLDSGITPNVNAHNWTMQGNYVGVDITGLIALPNCSASTAGAFSLDNSNGHTVGGAQPTAINVISGNGGKGIAPNNTANTLVEGNYIGVGRDGSTPVPNQQDGITYSGYNTDFTIRNNILSHNGANGIYIDDAEDATIQGNIIMNNQINGILAGNMSEVLIGGSATEYRNVVSNNGQSGASDIANIKIVGLPGASVSNTTIKGNYIGTNADGIVEPQFTGNTDGIIISADVSNLLIGGDDSSDSNIIAGNSGPGILVAEGYAPDLGPLTFSPLNIGIIGNSIYTNDTASVESIGSSGNGIDLYRFVLDNSLQITALQNLGPTPNDTGDSDTGPNGYINFPVLNSVSQDGSEATINYSLDAADSPTDQYRVEFFANDKADPSGYGEGQTFLGAINSDNGNNQTASLTLPNNTDLDGRYISATTTAIDATTDSGFGGTSEFSEVLQYNQENQDSGNLADTGQRVLPFIVLAILLLAAGSTSVIWRIKQRT